LEESLGLVKGSVDPGAIPTEFVGFLADAMTGAERSRSQEPALEKSVLEVGRDIVQSTLESDGFVVWKERWPAAAKYAACLTHDADSITMPLSHVLSRRVRFSAKDILLAAIGLRNPYDNISHVVSLERQRNLRSSFYFLSGTYDLRPRAGQLASLQKLGWDIGLHGDFGTHDSAEKMREAVTKIKATTGIPPLGVRQHYLQFDFGSTWKIMENAGFVYDSTVGNRDKIGFRVGLCNPFHPPDENWKPLRLLELPLVLMDTTLWGYLKRSEAEGMGDFQSLKQSVEGVNGLFTILWHQEVMRMKGGRIYPALLDLLQKDGCFVGSGITLADWWQRRAARLVREGKAFRMDEAPTGLVLRFKAKGGETAKATGGTAEADGETTMVKASGGPLKVAVS
jgi:hypothetical protein